MNISELRPNSHVIADGILYRGALDDIKKSTNPFQALWEAVTNAIEAILELKKPNDGYIKIRIFKKTDLKNCEIDFFDHIEVEDSGIGFNDINFERFLCYKDNRKGPKNKGSGRIQLLRMFDKCEFDSIFSDESKFKKRSFVLSMANNFLEKNAITYYVDTVDVDLEESKTILKLHGLLEKEPAYENLTAKQIKDSLCEHYMPLFCSLREKLPKITIERYKNDELIESETVSTCDLPEIDRTIPMRIKYSQYSPEKQRVVKIENEADFELKCFKVKKELLKANNIAIISKDEVINDTQINFDLLTEKDEIGGFRYLLFLSSNYIDSIVGDTRGDFHIETAREYKPKADNMFPVPTILYEDISTSINDEFKKAYPEVTKKEIEYLERLEELKAMFLLNDETVESFKGTFGVNATEETILKKVYEADSNTLAKQDAEIKKSFDELNSLDSTSPDYAMSLTSQINALVRAIPMQNRTALTHYVARRKLILELFNKALCHELECQTNSERNIDEKILHNIIFQQTSKDSENSDLWLINEEFIYFDGCSEKRLFDVKIGEKRLFLQSVSTEEEQYLQSLGENRKIVRPDVLLFPDEGKCIIIEFKNPDVNVSEHLNQITRYASLIRQFSADEFQIDTFYGYLIGEIISARDVRMYDGDFKEAHKFDFLFRANKVIAGENRSDGSLYTEVIKYSTLLERARRRNQIFISKLTGPRS